MKRILFVDDKPKIKLNSAITYLENRKVDFTYAIKNSVNSALLYLDTHKDEIDLVVLDLGLPQFDDGTGYKELNGLFVMERLFKETYNIPVVINSTTKIPDGKNRLKPYIDQGAIIQHLHYLYGEWLFEFLKKI